MAISDRLKSQRQKRGLTQTELARLAGVSQGLIARIESRNVKDPAASVIRRIANALGVTADWLIGMNEDDVVSLLETVGSGP